MIMKGPPVKRSRSCALGDTDSFETLPHIMAHTQEEVDGQFDDAPSDDATFAMPSSRKFGTGRFPPMAQEYSFPRSQRNSLLLPMPKKDTIWREFQSCYPSYNAEQVRHVTCAGLGSSFAPPLLPASPPSLDEEGSKWDSKSKPLFAHYCSTRNDEETTRKDEEHERTSDSGISKEDGVGDADVLFGRGGGTNRHSGNRYFRALVCHYRPKYVLAKKAEKKKIANDIVSAVQEAGGRFLKKDEATGSWQEVDDKKAADKASQAIREGLASRMRQVLLVQGQSNEQKNLLSQTKESVHFGSLPPRKRRKVEWL